MGRRILNDFVLFLLLFCLFGCSVSPSQVAERMSDEEVVEFVRWTPVAECVWYGANKWKLDESGWDGGGHGAYEFHSDTNHPYYYLFSRLFWGSERIDSNPRILFPLLKSKDVKDVLKGFYCYKHAGIPGMRLRPDKKYIAQDHHAELADILRKLLNENRDVRVRFLAASTLRRCKMFTLQDLDRMLSDENFSVQYEGMTTVYNILSQLEGVKGFGMQLRYFTDLEGDKIYEYKEKLGDILLGHLNDHHFYIRASCYSSFARLVKRRIPAGKKGSYTYEKAKLPKHKRDWERKSWYEVRDDQKKLIAWWEANKDDVARNYGPDWRAENDR